MTYKEAKERLQNIHFCGPDSLDESIRRSMDQEAIDTAIEAIDELRPIKPILDKDGYTHTSPIEFHFKCAICETGLIDHWVACPICGKRIDWES